MSSQPQALPELPPSLRILQLATGYWISRTLYVVTQLGIADLLKDGPKTAEELATATRNNPDALFRVMRVLAVVGVFAEAGPRRFALTPLSESLRSDVPGSVRAQVLSLVGDLHWTVYKDLGYSVQTGQPAFDHVFGQNAWEYMSEHPEESLLVQQQFAAFTAAASLAIAEAYDFSAFPTIMDVGGGNGTLLAAILKKHLRPRGILFDLPYAIEHARAAGLLPAGRGELMAGDFLESIPAGADAYVFKNIIHDWPDDKARAILKVCRRAMSGSNKLLLVEALITPGGGPAVLADIEMLVIHGSRERTEEDFRQLLASAGFRLDRIVPTKSPSSIIESAPV
jgi:hypothetical protein